MGICLSIELKCYDPLNTTSWESALESLKLQQQFNMSDVHLSNYESRPTD